MSFSISWKSFFYTLKMNLGYLRRSKAKFKSIVENYPDNISGKAPVDMFNSFKGYLRNDLDKCTGCSECIPACPVKALEFKAESRVDGSIHVQEFRIDLGRCFACGVCVDICPEGSLSFSKDFELVSRKAEDLVMVLHGTPTKAEPEITRIRTYEVRR